MDNSKKDLIVIKLENLKKIYDKDDKKKWGSKALSSAIQAIKKYEGSIISGEQMKKDIKGIGEKISIRIDEILKTGTLEELNSFTEEDKNNDIILENLLLITGVGPTRAKKWASMNIKNVDELSKAIQNNIIKSTHHIDVGIKYYYDFQKKIPREEIDTIKIFLTSQFKKIDKELIFEICGSYRRGAPESGDIDILISHPNFYENIENEKILDKVVKELKKNKFIIDYLTKEGNTKFMGVCKLENNLIGRRIDIRVVNYSSYFTSLLYFTGSKNFNVQLRNKALENNYSLNEYSLTDLNNNNHIILKNEEEIFEILKIPYLSPNER
jgi:DNA polymerase beta